MGESIPNATTGQVSGYRPVQISRGEDRAADVSDMATRIVKTYMAASPEHVQAGERYYSREAHGAARALAMGEDPNSGMGQFLRTMPSPGEWRREVPQGETEERKRTDYDNAFETRVTRNAAAIARLSPSGGGMAWDKPSSEGRRLMNAKAVHELAQMNDDTVAAVMKGDRSSLKGKDLVHASSVDIGKAHDILTGKVAPEEDVKTGPKDRVKVGSFYSGIRNPDENTYVAVDARSHDIATGERRPWAGGSDTRRLDKKSRYDILEQAHQVATTRINAIRAMRGQSAILPHQVQAITWLADKAGQEYGEGETHRAGGRKSARTPLGQEGMAPHARFTEPRGESQ